MVGICTFVCINDYIPSHLRLFDWLFSALAHSALDVRSSSVVSIKVSQGRNLNFSLTLLCMRSSASKWVSEWHCSCIEEIKVETAIRQNLSCFFYFFIWGFLLLLFSCKFAKLLSHAMEKEAHVFTFHFVGSDGQTRPAVCLLPILSVRSHWHWPALLFYDEPYGEVRSYVYRRHATMRKEKTMLSVRLYIHAMRYGERYNFVR